MSLPCIILEGRGAWIFKKIKGGGASTRFRGGKMVNKLCSLEYIIKQKRCFDPGLNMGPLVLQSNALPPELSRLVVKGGTLC